jgi:hypothetical protein
MAKFIWHEGGFPHDMEIRQVYGVIDITTEEGYI